MSYGAVAGNHHAVAEHCLALDVAVMTYVGLCRDKAVVAYRGSACGAYATVDDYVFTDYIVVADGAIGLFAFPAEVLRVGLC